MMKFLRSQSQTVLVVVLGVIGLGFLFYGNAGNLLTSSGGGHTSNDFGRIDGEDLSVAELYDAMRNTRDLLIIHGDGEKLRQPGASQQLAEEAWRQLLLLHEADKLHINISDKELIDYIKSMPVFQKDGAFSPDIYKSRMVQVQSLLHLPADTGVDAATNTQALFEKLLRDDLRTQAVSTALFGNIHSSAHDLNEQYGKYYGPTTVSYVTFDPKVQSEMSQVIVTPAEIEAEYKNHPTDPAYRTKEKRKVDYVLWTLTPEQAKLPEDQKTKAKDALGQKALDFALALQPDPSASGTASAAPDFQAEAKKEGLTPVTTDFFADDSSPAGLPPSPAFNSAAFALTKDNTTSKVVELDNGVAILHLEEIQPSELRPLAEVKPDIEKKLFHNQSIQAAATSAKLVSKLMQGTLSKGADFKTAAANMKLKPESTQPFVPFKVAESDAKMQRIAYTATTLKPGQVSDPVPMGDDTYVVIHLDKRDTPDPAGLADFEKQFSESQEHQVRSMVYADWATWKSKQPGTHKPPELEAYGTVE